MEKSWKAPFVVVTIILVISFLISASLRNQLKASELQLFNSWAEMRATQEQLNSVVAELGTTKNQLEVIYTQLDDTTEQLKTTQEQLSSTSTQLLTTQNQLDSTRTQLRVANVQLEAAENENTAMLNQYSDLRAQINARFGYKQDAQNYIIPDEPAVVAKVQEITGGYAQDVNTRWRDYERLYRWVTENIRYSYDSYTPLLPTTIDGTLMWRPESWRMPVETLEDKTGDCEDMATLLASMLLNYTEERFAFWVVEIQSTAPNNTAHAAVAFPVAGGQLAILDPAGNYYSSDYYGGRLQSYGVSLALKKWLSHWSKDMPNARIYMAFSDKFYHEFASTEEFANWALEY